MSDFQEVRRRGAGGTQQQSQQPTLKYADQHHKLVEMGFNARSVQKALESSQGDLEAATMLLLDDDSSSNHNNGNNKHDEQEKEVKSSGKGGNNKRGSNNESSNNAKNTNANTATNDSDTKDIHQKMMATYKVNRCRENDKNHDKRMCTNYHSLSDRRRNPFEVNYSCFDCPAIVAGIECKDGDNCQHAHTMLEKMFHPDLYKISMCQRTQRGEKCDRGTICAFAHNEKDLRVIPTTAESKAQSVEMKLPTKPLPDSPKLVTILDRIITLIKEYGSEGAFGTDIAKKYGTTYKETLKIEDESGEEYKFRDIVASHPNIVVIFNRNSPPKYVYDETKSASMAAAAAAAINESKASAAAAAAANEDSKPSSDGSLNGLRDRIIQTIKASGNEGVLGSDLPKRYYELFGEKLGEVNDESGNKLKLKDFVSSLPSIKIQMLKLQPKYLYDESSEASSSSSATKSSSSASTQQAASSASTKDTTAVNSNPPPQAPPAAVHPSPAEIEKVLSSSTVKTGKSWSSIAAKKPVQEEAPKPPAAPQQHAQPASQPAPQHEQQPTSSHSKPQQKQHHQPEQHQAVQSVSVVDLQNALHHQKNLSDLLGDDKDEGGPSSEDPIFTAQDNQINNDLNKMISDSSPSNHPHPHPSSSSQFSSHHNDGSNMNFSSSAFGFGSHGANDNKNSSGNTSSGHHDTVHHPTMGGAPGLTKIHKDDGNTPSLASLMSGSSSSNTSANSGNDHDRLTHANSQVTALQQQVNKLQSELVTRNNDYDNQSLQLRNVMSRLAELESKSNDEHFKLQLKAKTDDLTKKTHDFTNVEEE
jgi:hypothetical protein